MQFEDNTYGTIRKRKIAKAQPTAPLQSNPASINNVDNSTIKRKKPLPMAPGGKENSGDNAPLSCSKLSAQDMKKELPISPTNVISPTQRRISNGNKKKRSMSPKPVRPKTWTMSDRFDPKVLLSLYLFRHLQLPFTSYHSCLARDLFTSFYLNFIASHTPLWHCNNNAN